MIAYLEGRLLKKDEDRIILLVHQVGYEILLPAFVRTTIEEKEAGDTLAFFIYYPPDGTATQTRSDLDSTKNPRKSFFSMLSRWMQ